MHQRVVFRLGAALREHFATKRIRINRNRWVFHLDVSFEDAERMATAIAEFEPEASVSPPSLSV